MNKIYTMTTTENTSPSSIEPTSPQTTSTPANATHIEQTPSDPQAVETVSDTAHHAVEKVGDVTVQAVEKVSDMTHKTADKVSDLTQQTAQKVIEESSKYQDAYYAVDKIVQGFWERLPYICIAIVVFLLFWGLSKLFKYFLKRLLTDRTPQRQNLVLVLYRVGSIFILFIGLMIALVIAIPSFTPAQLVGSLGIGSVAIGFAFKDIFQNLLSGILILLGEPFKIGDYIQVNGMEGTVEDIQIRATYLRSVDGRRIVIPNATVYISPITVNTAYMQRRCEFVVGIGYDDNIEQAKQIIERILTEQEHVLTEPSSSVYVSVLADFSVNLTVRWWINTSTTSITESVSHIQILVKQAFDEQGISIPYPIQTLNIESTKQRVKETIS